MIFKYLQKFNILIISIFFIILSNTNFAFSDNHLSKKEIIKELKKEITELGAKPVKNLLYILMTNGLMI